MFNWVAEVGAELNREEIYHGEKDTDAVVSHFTSGLDSPQIPPYWYAV